MCSTPLPPGSLLDVKAQAERLADRARRAELHCAVVGQLKRGKSTLLNALLGVSLLPTGVTPLTAISTYLRAGRAFFLREVSDSGTAELELEGLDDLRRALSKRVTEKDNPNNKLRLRRVEVELDSQGFLQGITFIDTPGIGSTLVHNTDVAFATLPECDLALFVISPDPPITAVELSYLKQVAGHVAEIIIILNKTDLLDGHDRSEIEAFVRRVLDDADLTNVRIIAVSARLRLASGPDTDVDHELDGFVALTKYLSSVAAERKARLLADVSDIKTARLAGEAIEYLDQHLAALQMPGDTLRKTLALFDGSAKALSHEASSLVDMAGVSRNAVLRELEKDIAAIKQSIGDETSSAIEQWLSEGELETTVASVLEASIPASFAAAFPRFEQRFDALTDAALKSHIDGVEQLIRKARDVGRNLFQLSHDSARAFFAVSAGVRPYWISEKRPSLPAGGGGFYDRLLPVASRLERSRRRLNSLADELITRNAENMRWSIRRSVEESFRAFVASWQSTLERAQSATRAAIITGLAQLDQIDAEAKPDLTALRTLRDQIRSQFRLGAGS